MGWGRDDGWMDSVGVIDGVIGWIGIKTIG